MKVIFVAGPRRARTIFGVILNIWKARRAARRLWKQGWAVICPHMNTASFKDDGIYFRGYCQLIKRCDAIYMLKNWQRSAGAGIEYQVAIDNHLEIIFEE